MRKITTLMLCVGVSFSVLGQKKELKTAEKLMKKANFEDAGVELNKVTDMVTGTNFETYYFYLKGMQANGNETTHDYVSASKYFHKTIAEELKTGKKKFSKKATDYLYQIKKNLYESSNTLLKEANYVSAGDNFKTLYTIDNGCKNLYELLINCRLQSKDYDKAVVHIEKSLELLGDSIYNALDTYSSNVYSFYKKEDRDAAIKKGSYLSLGGVNDVAVVPDSIVEKSYQDLVYIYTELGQSEKKEELIKKAVKKYPQNIVFLEHYAEIVYKNGDHKSYLKVLEDNLKLAPDNKILWYNLGVTSKELGEFKKSHKAYDKAIELDSDYRDAYVNKGLLIMEEEKQKIKELNKSAGTKKYIVIKREIEELYKSASVYFEKAYSIEKGEGVRSMLKNIYSSLGQKSKANAL